MYDLGQYKVQREDFIKVIYQKFGLLFIIRLVLNKKFKNGINYYNIKRKNFKLLNLFVNKQIFQSFKFLYIKYM